MKLIKRITTDELNRMRRRESRPTDDGTTWSVCDFCGVRGTQSGMACLKCIDAEIERRKGGAS